MCPVRGEAHENISVCGALGAGCPSPVSWGRTQAALVGFQPQILQACSCSRVVGVQPSVAGLSHHLASGGGLLSGMSEPLRMGGKTVVPSCPIFLQ